MVQSTVNIGSSHEPGGMDSSMDKSPVGLSASRGRMLAGSVTDAGVTGVRVASGAAGSVRVCDVVGDMP